jgi:hypothetical protein
MAKSWGPKEHMSEIEKTLAIHGDYTEGFYEEQWDKLFADMKR